MGVLDFIKGQAIEIIEWTDDSRDTLSFRFPDEDKEIKNGAQLIFTTHDTSLLDAPDLFRRDQVWFVEKERDQASRLFGLSEFSPRKNEALERGYLMGRYGGLPLLGDLELKH